MNILWFSNAPWARTGYGTQTAQFWWRIQKLGHKVTLGSNYGLAGAVLNYSEQGEETRVLPLGYHGHGIDIIAPHALYVKADVVITLYDAWVFPQDVTNRFRWCPWLPIDHHPAPPSVLRALETAWQPICYSRYAERMLKEAGLDPRYVPHGIDMDVYKPIDRDEARKALKFIPADANFVAAMVAANKGSPSRKSFGEVLYTWREFVKDHPKSVLYLHTHPGPEMQGYDLPQICRELDMPEGRVYFADPYWTVLGFPESYMRNVYNAADVLLSPSQGEGFGLPILEAQACGCPIITTDCTSMTELTFSGWKVEGQPFWTPQGAWQFIPNMAQIRERLEEAYKLKGYDKLRRQAREGALPYDAARVTEEHWKPVLEEIAREVAESETLETISLDAA